MIDWEDIINGLGAGISQHEQVAQRLFDLYLEGIRQAIPEPLEAPAYLTPLIERRSEIVHDLLSLISRSEVLDREATIDSDAIRAFIACGLRPLWSSFLPAGISFTMIDLLSLVFLVGYQLGQDAGPS